MAKKKNRKLLIVGWDAADWKIINPLLDSGQLPALERLVNKGVIGNIATLDPPLSPMLWTSIATGMTADKHGILNFIEPHPDKAEIRPISSTTRKVKAFWNILNQEGLRCNIVGWWPSNPAEPINGAMVSDLYPKVKGKLTDEWQLYPGSVHPPELEEKFKSFRIHPSEMTLNHIRPFVPNAEALVAKGDKLLDRLALIMAEAASLHNCATYLMEHTEWDVTAVYYDAIDVTCHAFMKFHPPQMPGVPDDQFQDYKGVIASMYRWHDMMLERLLDLAGEDTTVLLVSDHGFHSDHLRPKTLPKDPDAPALEHRPFGVLCLSGPGIKKDERVYGATLLDVTPTILTLFGLPVGKDMDGNPLVSIFEEPVIPEVIPSWELVEGDSGRHSAEVQEDPIAAQEAMRQLVELGYMEAPGEDKEKNVRMVIEQSNFHLARVYIHQKKYAEALPLLQKLHTDNPGVPRYALRYAACLHHLRRMEECRTVIDRVRKHDRKELPQLDILEANLLLAENKPRLALDRLLNAEKTVSNMPHLHVQLGTVYNRIQQWDDSIRAFGKALAIDPESETALLGRGVANLKKGNYEEAIVDLLDAVGLVYHLPQGHYFLGEALYRFGEYERAADAFRVCITQEPGFKRAYAWLATIYEKHIPDEEKAVQYRKFMQERIRGSIVVVSGLPRSGTSMMMQMLEAGGLETLTDENKGKDQHNPNGYFEYQKVQSLNSDHSWLEEADGKAIKVTTQLLQFIPPRFTYKVIYMTRDMNEILLSQQVMLARPTNQANITMVQTYRQQEEKTLAWLRSQPHIQVLEIGYNEALSAPVQTAEKINSFLNMDLEIQPMANAIDPSLYRNRLTGNDHVL